jgi:hypothetical protein
MQRLDNLSIRKTTLQAGIIILSLYINSYANAQEDVVTPYFSVLAPNGWVYKENFLSDSNIILTTNEFADTLNTNKAAQSLLDLVQRGVLLELGMDEGFRADNASLERYVKYFLNNANESDVILQNATIGGEGAIRIFINGTEIAKTSPMKNVTGSINSISYLFLHRGEPYYIYYIANENRFNTYLSHFEQIAKTFRFLK